MLDKPRQSHNENGPDVSTVIRSGAQKSQKTKGHDSLAEELRLVHSDVAHKKSAHCRYKECRANSGSHSTPTEPPNAQGDRRRDRNHGNQGQQSAG
jgi:hypothetical protein